MADELNGDAALHWEAFDEETNQTVCPADGYIIEGAKSVQVSSGPVLVELFGMDDCHKYNIYRYVGCGDGDYWQPYRCGGCPVVLDAEHPMVMLFLPGRYKVQLFGCCEDMSADPVIMVRTKLTDMQAQLYIQQSCCCPYTEELSCG